MSGIANSQNSAGKKKKIKRKVISPLDTCKNTSEISQVNRDPDYTNTTNKRFNFDDYTSCGMSFSPYSQHGGFVGLMNTTPPGFSNPIQAVQAPPWACEILEEMKLIKEKLTTVDKTVNVINVKVTDMEESLKMIDLRVTETEKSCSFLSTELDRHRDELKFAKSEIKNLKKSCDNFEYNSKKLFEKERDLDDKLSELEMRDMRDNLLFYGIAECEKGKNEDSETLVKSIISDILDISDNVSIDRAHRIGPQHNKKVRPIVVKFHYPKERELVRKSSFNNNAALKALGYGVGAQLPKRIREARKPLYPAMNDAKKANKAVKFVGSKLFIDGEEFKLPTTK